jgi:general secretion pathway protein J
VSKLASQQGFTLIELLIAIVLTAIISTMSYQALESASNGATRTREVLRDINKLDKAWQLIGQDMRNINISPANQAPNLAEMALQGASLTTKGKNSLQLIMQFTRRGWVNPMGRLRSDLQLVNYRIEDGKLIRDYLPQRNKSLEDMDFERESLHQTLLENVSDIQLRFLSEGYIKNNGKSALEGEDYSKNWEPTWPPLNQPGGSGVPMALEITIEITEENKGASRSVRLYELPQL